MSRDSVVFLHVMKCGGTSVRAGLATGIVGHRDGPDVFELDGQAAKIAAAGKHADNWRFRDALLSYVLLTSRPPLILGHFRYRDRYAEYLDRAHFVTVLRDPVERIISLYKYRRYKDDVDVSVSMPFERFLASQRWSQEGHAYVDTFCGRDDLDPRSDEAVAAAVTNLRRFHVIGFVDALDKFSKHLTDQLGVPVTIPMLNRSPAPEDEGVDAAAIEHARAVCAPDIEVFEQAVAAFA